MNLQTTEQYLIQVLGGNSRLSGEEMIKLRERHLSRQEKAKSKGKAQGKSKSLIPAEKLAAQQKLRNNLYSRLNDIRWRMFAILPESSRKKLLNFPQQTLAKFPDLEAYRNRLLAATLLWEKWPEITDEIEMDSKFCDWLQQVSVSTSSETGALLTNLLHDPEVDVAELSQFQRAAGLLKKHYPDETQFLRDVLNPLTKHDAWKSAKKRLLLENVHVPLESQRIPFWAFVVLFLILKQVLTIFFNS